MMQRLATAALALALGASAAQAAWPERPVHVIVPFAAGGRYLTGRKETGPNVYYEVKYQTPEGIVFDVTESGWKGAVKDVEPARAA